MAVATERGDELPYKISKREVIAETPELSVKVFTLAQGEVLPWHFHSEIDDIFFCLEGRIGVETRAPEAKRVLRPGERLTVPARTEHLVTNAGSGTSRYLLVQGVGKYDFVPADKAPK
ncbi:MAG TPA: cupin domain-containing protein [Alphaproteobacteria bacterium]|nr:cupin domain-containing protein [Alphaproteobacteria bacterium]